jgi:hypothetical protein
VDSTVADEIGVPWESEEIPDEDLLYMRVHRAQLDSDGKPIPGAFRNHGRAMSTNWSKYSSPEETRQRARSPSENAVIQMMTGEVRAVPGQSVVHTPDLPTRNRAHTDVTGEKTPEVRIRFSRVYQVVLALRVDA